MNTQISPYILLLLKAFKYQQGKDNGTHPLIKKSTYLMNTSTK